MNYKDICKKISSDQKADIYFYNGAIDDHRVDDIIKLIRKNKVEDNIILVLTTLGGDADSAFRLVRYIKSNYQKFILYVIGHCKSAGTIIALGADEIVMFDFGEFGPLDVQVSKDDELTRISGLTLQSALMHLQNEAFNMFENYFLNLKEASGYSITTKTAAEISSSIVIGLLSPIYAQIEPLRLGEFIRSMRIAIEYGRRISDNIKGIVDLVTGYVCHSFVIDYIEAQSIFGNVRKPNDDEIILEELILDKMRFQTNKALLMKLPEKTKTDSQKDENNNEHPKSNEEKNNGANQPADAGKKTKRSKTNGRANGSSEKKSSVDTTQHERIEP